jgi:hypothetical protein
MAEAAETFEERSLRIARLVLEEKELTDLKKKATEDGEKKRQDQEREIGELKARLIKIRDTYKNLSST